MEYSLLINEVVKFWWVIPIVLMFSILRAPWFKGLLGEASVKLAALLRLPEDTYYPIHNVTLPTPDGTTQIDHVFVSRYGIFVVETKNMKGWVFGEETQAQWTQKLFKKSFKFQNPLRQNYKHVKALESILDVPPEVIRSVIVFVGGSVLKTPMPANVTSGAGYVTYIKSFSEPVLSESQIEYAVMKIESVRLEPTRKTHRQHARQVRARVDGTAERKCPKCGSKIVLRRAKRGARSGNEFWGCSAYPKCRFAQSANNGSV